MFFDARVRVDRYNDSRFRVVASGSTVVASLVVVVGAAVVGATVVALMECNRKSILIYSDDFLIYYCQLRYLINHRNLENRK